jgi:type IV pilus assembly protein PilE
MRMAMAHMIRSVRAGAARGGRGPRQAGFSLIELMIVVAIVAILATIATASYKSYALRANRAEARQALLSIQAAQEKFFLQNNSYATTLALIVAAAPAGLGVPLDASGNTPAGHYQVSVIAATATTYTVQAKAIGSQATGDDPACQTFQVNEQGVFTPPSGTICWH